MKQIPICVIFFIIISHFLVSFTSLGQITEKPYSLAGDKENQMKLWEQTEIKNPGDSLINKLENILKQNNKQAFDTLQDIYWRINNNDLLLSMSQEIVNLKSDEMIAQCCMILGFFEFKPAIPSLVKLLESNSVKVKYYAAFGLAQLGEKDKCFNTFAFIWDSVSWQNKQGINRGLRNIGTNESISMLIKNTQDEDSYIACGAAICLAQIGYYKVAFPILKSMLSIDNRKLSALNGLAYIGDEQSLDLIRSMVNDKDQIVRQRSKTILKNFE